MRRMARTIQPQAQGDDVHEALHLLGHTVRAAIVHELRSGPLLGPELGHRLGLPSGTTGPHLVALRASGTITSEIQPGHGRPVLHCLNTRRADELTRLLVSYLMPQFLGLSPSTSGQPQQAP